MEQRPEDYEVENPITFECARCDEDHETTFENTIYYHYERDLTKNHIRTVCENTGYLSVYFTETAEDRCWAEQFAMMADEDGEPLQYCEDEDLIALWERKYDITPPKEYELTDRLGRQVAFLAYLLNNTEDALILEELSKPMPPRDTPGRWI